MKKLFVITLVMLVAGFLFYLYPRDNAIESAAGGKPRILLTSPFYNHAGGITTFAVSLVQSILYNHFEFAVAAPETSDIYQACNKLGIKTYACDFPFKFKKLTRILPASKALTKILKEYKPDIIHSNGSHDRTLIVWNSLLLEKKPSIVATFHGVKRVSKDPYHWLFYNKLIDANMFVSNSAFKINAEKKGLKIDNIHIIENAVDLETFKPTLKNNSLREALNIPENYFVFGSSAGLSDYKRVDLMLEALKLFPSDSQFKVIVLGRDPQVWIEKAKSMGIDHFLIFPGFQEDTRSFCSLFDVGFILSTRLETSSFASREMMAMGIPLISSSFSGLKDNVEDHVNGVFVEPGNVQDIYTAMNFFLNMSSSELESYKENARLKAERSFDAKAQFQAIENLYRDLLKKKTINEKSAELITFLAH